MGDGGILDDDDLDGVGEDHNDGTTQSGLRSYGGGVDTTTPEPKRQRAIKRLCGELLPRAGREMEWPIIFDHCYYRVCYDVAVGDEWTVVYDDGPGYEVLHDWELRRAVRIAKRMLRRGRTVVDRLNLRSLHYRDEVDHYPHESPVICPECGYSDDSRNEVSVDRLVVTHRCPDCESGLWYDYDRMDVNHQYRR